MANDKPKKKRKIIGARIRVGVGDSVHFEEDEEVEVLGEDTTLIVSSEEATGAEIIGKEVLVQMGTFEPILREIDKRDLDNQAKEELKARVRELEKELSKKSPNKSKIDRIMTWFKINASWLLPIIFKILSKIPK